MKKQFFIDYLLPRKDDCIKKCTQRDNYALWCVILDRRSKITSTKYKFGLIILQEIMATSFLIQWNLRLISFYTHHTHTHTHRRYNPCRVLADSRRRLQPSLSLALILQFLTPKFSASLITPFIHLRFGLPARLLPSGLFKVIFLHGRLSCIRTICPAHLNLVILIVVTRSASSYRQYSSSLYLDLHVASSEMGP